MKIDLEIVYRMCWDERGQGRSHSDMGFSEFRSVYSCDPDDVRFYSDLDWCDCDFWYSVSGETQILNMGFQMSRYFEYLAARRDDKLLILGI